ncbi:Putative aminoglycoside phosphotransferase, protein kinase-like domain superfamily [Septoria linicola]|uniref:Aminoglycoside phosphotransferase, protein kinase-like domain superfamily n=1 Tax=Septoria linicola TaxID=215465 RepID=A0A9Q9EKT5_9PEZI|nr:putative aminoglycoside phosphotransferase, protein kinase-like domain superfamily [Septoria linicola]USW54390.1 Putative aminoglycoside phosphotransferase, protein kinase-like domain superfamily [Septoria linicola]
MAGPIRQQIDLDKLSRYIDQHAPEIKTPLDVKQFGYGQSNPTYLLSDKTGAKYVMRKKPPGKLLSKTAHQVDREYRIIAALQDTNVPVPKAICLCEDDSIVGTAFYIMGFLNGRIFADPAIPDVSAEHRNAMWKSAVTTLAKFHSVPPKSVNMESFGRPNNFYNRQLKTFATLSVAQAKTKDIESGEPVGAIPHYDDMVKFFGDAKTQPKDRGTFVHGDYKIDNMVFHPTEPYVIGILDWEMATIGHPLSDMVNLTSPWLSAGDPLAEASGRANLAFKNGATPGLPTKKEVLKWYHEVVDWEFAPKEVTWGDAFGLYRGAIICQGIAARYAVRQASSPNAKEYGVQMRPFGEMAWKAVQRYGELAREEDGRAKL